jgi:hypothetical protein
MKNEIIYKNRTIIEGDIASPTLAAPGVGAGVEG